MKNIVCLVFLILCVLAACSPQKGVSPDSPVATTQGEGESPPGAEAAPGEIPAESDASEYIEASSGPLVARIFSAQETTINQREFLLQGWVNRAGVVSANDNIITTAAEENFSTTIALDDGPNLIEVIVSDHDGNEVRFELIVFVEEE